MTVTTFPYAAWVTVRRAGIFAIAAYMLFAASPAFATENKGNLPPKVQEAINAILETRKADAPLPEATVLHDFMEYAMSPLSPSPTGEEVFPARRDEGQGIYWRSTVQVPLATMVRYLYDPKLPLSAVYPASIRRTYWKESSDILKQKTPLWEQLDAAAEKPVVLRGQEYEEITPDTFSGSYYSYTLDRLLMLTAVDGRKAVLAVGWQNGPSQVGKKATPIGDYEDWDFVYSGANGTLTSGIGWADTYMYSSCAIIVLYEDAPGGKNTGYAVFKWLNAGWSSFNMVKRHHITDGAARSFKGFKAFMESPKRPAAADIAAYAGTLQALSKEALVARFAPYSAKVTEAAATNDVLKTEDFQKAVANKGYGASLSKEELVNAMVVNFIKGKLGKSQLAGPLE